MQFQRRALYNLLRMNWLRDSSVKVDPWMVEDYRGLSREDLFAHLSSVGLEWDRPTFVAYAEAYDTPEDLVDEIVGEEEEVKVQDRIYLLLFEMWRRFQPEKASLSIFCDELDHQINLYDTDNPVHPDDIQDVLANLQRILDENLDNGGDPQEVFRSVADACANDIEGFLYDYIAEQIDGENFTYATEMLEGCYAFMADPPWFDFLRARLLSLSDLPTANRMIRKIIESRGDEPDLELYMEILTFLVQGGSQSLFTHLVQTVAPLVDREEEFQELLNICADFHRCLDHDYQERAIEQILTDRHEYTLDSPVKDDDPDRQELLKILSLANPPSKI